jgi:hypothetical protein
LLSPPPVATASPSFRPPPTTDTYQLFRASPSFEGQAATADPTGLDGDPIMEAFYLWAQVDTKRGLMDGTNTFRVVTGGTEEAPIFGAPLYSGKKLSNMHFYAQVHNAEGALVAKAYTGKGMFNNNPELDVAAGVDLVATIACTSYLCGGGSPAGGLAGAGVT